MKAELRMTPHAFLEGAFVYEVWYGGVFVATVTGADGPGVRVVSKHPMAVSRTAAAEPPQPYVTEILLRP